MQRRDGEVLSWGTPAKAMTTQAWQRISADGAPPGVYTPDMAEADMRAWKAKMAGQRTPGELRVEIRKTAVGKGTGKRPTAYAQVLLLVYADGEVRVSGNGTMAFSGDEWREFQRAVAEARAALAKYQADQDYKALPDHVRKAVEAL